MKVYKRTKDGAWMLNYTMDGKQRQIYLGRKQTAISAGRVADIVAEILLCRYRGERLPERLVERYKALDWKIQATLRRHGILSEHVTDVSLKELVDMFLESKSGVKPITIDMYNYRFDKLRAFFGDDKRVSEITQEDILNYKSYLLQELTLAPCTAAYNIFDCRAMFRYGLGRRLVMENPCVGIYAGPTKNDNRYRFVERVKVEDSLQGCEDEDLTFAVRLARYAGLRMASEIRYMKFSDFGKDGFFVREEGKTGRREVPFFRELREPFERKKHGHGPKDFVFSRVAVGRSTLASRYGEQLRKNDVERWPRIFNNLRASCVTEYDELGFNEKTLDSIFGNTEKIRKRHYIGFRRDRAFMQLLGTKNQIVHELIGMGGVMGDNIETDKIDLLIRYLESLKISKESLGPEKSRVGGRERVKTE